MRKSHPFYSNTQGSVLVATLMFFSVVMALGLHLYTQASDSKKAVMVEYLKAKSAIESDNLIKISSNLTQAQLAQNYNMTSGQLQTYLVANLPSYLPDNIELKTFSNNLSTAPNYSAIASGPFKGIQAENRDLSFDLQVGPKNTSQSATNLHVSTTISGIPITQFSFFGSSDLQWAYGYQAVEMSGRIHANGDMMIAGTNTDTKIRGSLTAAGRVYHPTQILGNGHPWTTYIALAPNYLDASLTEYKKTAVVDCTNCDHTGLNWSAYAMNRWAGQLQDYSHGVTKLDVRTIEPPQGQVYPSKFIIEPVRTTDNLSRYEKFAYKADIRIINGVWYLKNPTNADDWPGIPIWSDHPGSFTTWNDDGIEGATTPVGQEDIKTRLLTTGPSGGPTLNAWTGGLPPIKYSYYRYDTANSTLFDTTQAVVSYGNLIAVAGSNPVVWTPGHFPLETLCMTGESCTGGGCNLDANRIVVRAGDPITCDNGGGPFNRTDRTSDLLNGTRGGFRYGVSQTIAYGRDKKSKIWPMNFDVSAFQNALTCNGGENAGELGCYFGAGNFMQRPFNGIVYIANTWDGQNRLVDGLYPQRAPYMQGDTEVVQTALEGGGATAFPGSNTDTDQPAPLSPLHPSILTSPVQQILPMQLCSDNFNGRNFGRDHFKVPQCSKYKNHATFRARINALRIFNSRTIDSTILPKGITIATNLPVFTLGDVNSTSTTSSMTSTPWSPVFFAGDYFVPLSNKWIDQYARWDMATDNDNEWPNRTASNTTIFAGTSPSIFFYNEKWSGITLNKMGPSINFFPDLTHAIWNASSISYGKGTYYPPAVIVQKEDPHYRILANQPPGMPFVSVFTVTNWMTQEMKNENR